MLVRVYHLFGKTNIFSGMYVCALIKEVRQLDMSKHLLIPKCYIAIDMKSFYASVECVARGLDPLKANLLVADESRTDQTICLAVSPALKAIGVPSRPRLFEAKQAIENTKESTILRFFILLLFLVCLNMRKYQPRFTVFF